MQKDDFFVDLENPREIAENDFFVDLENPREFIENDFTKYGKEMEEKCIRMYNCPYRNTKFISCCPYCQKSHIKPKSYTGNIYFSNTDNQNLEHKSMGVSLKRRDTPQIMESFVVKIAK